jgi:glycosyltransferase involved in cell wall biosynthesis
MTGKLLMVIPSTVRLVDGNYEIESDYINNLRAYLRNFDHVTFACPVAPGTDHHIIRSQPIAQIQDRDGLTYIPLPYAYREDRYLRHFLSTKKRLASEINKADYLLFSPHSNYDWSTLAAELAIQLKRKYGIESDWDHRSVWRLQLNAMPFGAKKLRKTLWARSFSKEADRCLAHSSVALLQGQDVYDAYKDIAPNPRKVLNVQVSAEDHIASAELRAKVAKVKDGKRLAITYAGRMTEMKGSFDWLKAIHVAIESGVDLRAAWFGDGPLMPEMRKEVERLGIGRNVALAGVLGRDEVMARLRTTDIFLFCHKTGESPRCLSEALAAGCLLIGYGSAFPRDLVASQGGGKFAVRGDWKRLASIIVSLDRDRALLARLIEAAAASGRELDRDTAIQQRIDLIKSCLGGSSADQPPETGPGRMLVHGCNLG